MDQGPNPSFDVAPGSPDRMQLIFFLKVTGDLVEARLAGHRDLVLLACDPKAPIGARPWRRSKYEKIFQFAALLVRASGREHHLTQFLFAPPFLDHASSPRMQIMPGAHRSSARTDASAAIDRDAADILCFGRFRHRYGQHAVLERGGDLVLLDVL